MISIACVNGSLCTSDDDRWKVYRGCSAHHRTCCVLVALVTISSCLWSGEAPMTGNQRTFQCNLNEFLNWYLIQVNPELLPFWCFVVKAYRLLENLIGRGSKQYQTFVGSSQAASWRIRLTKNTTRRGRELVFMQTWWEIEVFTPLN